MTAKQRKNIYTKAMVALIVALNVAFACACLHINLTGYDVSPTLIACWFAFTGTELVAMAGIQITKVRRKADILDNDTDNRTIREEREEGEDDDDDSDDDADDCE